MRNDALWEFLEAMYGQQLPEGLVIELRYLDDHGRVHREYHDQPRSIRADRWNEASPPVWYGVGLRRAGGRGTKADVAMLPALWVDIDRQEDIRDVLARCPLPPTWVVRSGGGHHVYWQLRTPLVISGPEEIAWAESVMYGLAQAMRADPAARDVARVMGLPWTWNRGRGKKIYNPPVLREVLQYDRDARYSVGDFDRFRGKIPAGPEDLRVSDRIKALIRTGWYPDCGYASRSEVDAAVVTAMLAAGYTEEQIREVFRNNPVGEKYWEHGNDGDRYLRLTIDRCRVALKNRQPQVGTITEDGGQLKVWRNGWQTLLDQVPTVRAVLYDGQTLGFDLQLDGRTIVLWSSDFASSHALRRALRGTAAYLGTDTDAQRLMLWLREQQAPLREVVRVVGWHGDAVVFPTAEVRGGKIRQPQMPVIPSPPADRARLEAHDQWEDLAREVGRLLSQLHDPYVMGAVGGWAMATMVAPFVRSRTREQQFPHLLVHGQHGAGKTTLVDVVLLLLYGSPVEPYGPGTTRWALVSALAASNVLPVALDERREWRKGDLPPILRAAYNAQYEARGQRDLEVLRYRLAAPLLIAGETPYTDPALLDRTICVYATPAGRNEAALRALHALPLEKWSGGQYVRLQAMMDDLPAMWDSALDQASSRWPQLSDRQRHAWAVVRFGLQLYAPYWDSDMLWSACNPDASPAEPDAGVLRYASIREALRAMAELIRARMMREGVHFAIRDDRYFVFVPALALPLVEEYYSRYGSEVPVDRASLLLRFKEAARDGSPVVAVTRRHVGKSFVQSVVIDMEAVEQQFGIPSSAFTATGV